MKAIVQRESGSLKVEEVETPSLEKNQILMKVHRSGICTNDIRDYTGENKYSFPRIGGHEYSGEIVEIGEAVDKSHFSIGDHVVSYIIPYCGECYYCHRGDTNLCKEWATSEIFYNEGGISGFKGFSEYVAVDSKDVFKYSKDIPYNISVFTEPLACVVNSVHQAKNMMIGDDVLVIGGGTMGMLHIMLLKNMGYRVILSEPNEQRREDALKIFGAHIVIDPVAEKLGQRIAEITEGYGVSAVFNTTGIPAIAEESVGLLSSGGSVIMFSSMHPNDPINVDAGKIHTAQTVITGANSPTLQSYSETVSLLSKKIIDPTPLLSYEISYENIQEAMEKALSLDTYKIIIKMAE